MGFAMVFLVYICLWYFRYYCLVVSYLKYETLLTKHRTINIAL
jgi:hypothetical protein